MIAKRLARVKPRLEPGQGQIVAVFALMMIVILAMVGVGIDLSNARRTAEELQRAADAAALAGVVYLPEATGSTIAEDNANSVAQANGFGNGGQGGATIVSSVPNSSLRQLTVTISTKVRTPFLSVIGRGTITVARSAVASYDDPITMGAPDHMLGFAPYPTAAFNDVADSSDPQSVHGQLFPQGFWLNLRGPYSGYEHGDAYSPLFVTNSSDYLSGNSSKNAIDPCGVSPNPYNRCSTSAGGTANLTPNPEYNQENASTSNFGYNFEFKLPPSMNHAVLLKMLDPLDECALDTSNPAHEFSGSLPLPAGKTNSTWWSYQDWKIGLTFPTGGSSADYSNGNTTLYPTVKGLVAGNNSASEVAQGNASLDNCDIMYWKDSAGNQQYSPLTLKITVYQPSTRSADSNPQVPANSSLSVLPNTVSVATGQNPIYAGAEWQQVVVPGQSCGFPASQCPKTEGAHSFQWLTLAKAINTLPTIAYVRVSVEAVVNSAYYPGDTYGQDYSGTFGTGDKQFALASCDIVSNQTETNDSYTQTVSAADPGAYGDIFNSADWTPADPTGLLWDTGCPDPNLDPAISSSMDSSNRFEVNGREAISIVTDSIIGSGGTLGDFIPLAEIPPRFAGSTVTVRLFDAGDVSSANNFISILGPGDDPGNSNFTSGSFVGNYSMGAGKSFKSEPYQLSLTAPSGTGYSPAGQGRPPFWCGAAYSGLGTDYAATNEPRGTGALCPPSSAPKPFSNQGVQVANTSISPANVIANGTWLEFHVQIPAAGSYVGTSGKDWWKVLYNLSGASGTGANDTTTWQISSGAAPVHLLKEG